MEIITVKAEDVFEDEDNPRADFGDLKSLAESFALNKLRPGQPVNPPVLVRDGGIYRVVDGARRYRAMRLIGTKEFDAIVCEDYTDADSILAMLATDDKKQLTPVEQSKGVQRALLLGVAPSKVEKASKRKGAARVRRAMEVTGSEASMMSIDHLLAIEEFAEDEARRDRLINATEASYKEVLAACRKESRNEKALEAMTARAYDLGYEVADERPDGMRYVASYRTADDVPEPGEDGLVAVPCCSWEASLAVYGKAESKAEADPETARLKLRMDTASALIAQTSIAHRGFMLRDLDSVGHCATVKRLAVAAMFALDGGEARSYQFSTFADRLCEERGIEKSEALAGQCSGVMAAYAMEYHCGEFREHDAVWFGPTASRKYHLANFEAANARLEALLEALRADGYEETDADREFRAVRDEAVRELAEKEMEE